MILALFMLSCKNVDSVGFVVTISFIPSFLISIPRKRISFTSFILILALGALLTSVVLAREQNGSLPKTFSIHASAIITCVELASHDSRRPSIISVDFSVSESYSSSFWLWESTLRILQTWPYKICVRLEKNLEFWVLTIACMKKKVLKVFWTIFSSLGVSLAASSLNSFSVMPAIVSCGL